MANYLVTGAAGFIASRVSDILLSEGHEVTGIDNLNDAYDTRLKTWRLERLTANPKFRFIQADIGERAAMGLIPSEVQYEAVVNLAARAGVRQSTKNPWVYVDTNTTGTVNLLELCRERNIGKFVLASTSSLYGAHNSLPYSEDADTSKPLSPYAASKAGAETMCHSYHTLHGIDVTVFRYFTVYGPAGRPDMSVFRFVKWIREGEPVVVFGDGKQSRDFTYVDDIARGTVAGLKRVGFEVMNLGSDSPVELMELIRLAEKYTGRKANLQYKETNKADVPATWANVSKARNLLGWVPQVKFDEGVKRSVEWYENNRSWAREVSTAE